MSHSGPTHTNAPTPDVEPTPTSADYKPPLLDVDVCMTVEGRSDSGVAAFRGGAYVGYDSHESPPASRIPVEFVDWPYEREDDGQDVSWERHLDVVKREQPKYAVAPDIYSRDDYMDIIEKSRQLSEYAEEVIVVPKGVHPSEIPADFRIGIPFRGKFEGMPHGIWEFDIGHDAHILGGNPRHQVRLARMFENTTVRSIDTAHPVMKSQWGKYYDRAMNKYRDIGGGSLHATIEKSYRNLLEAWNGGSLRFTDWLEIRQEYFDAPEGGAYEVKA